MKIPKVKYVPFKSKRHFGIELEVNQKIHARELVKIVSATDPDRPVIQSAHYEQDYDNDYWHIKFDRSCGDVADQGGWEVASYKAGGYKDVEMMGKVADAMKSAGAVVNDECGFHIHAETADFKHHMMATLVAHWLKIEPVILEMLPKHRRNNKYAKPLTKRFDFSNKIFMHWERFWETVRPQRYDNPNRRVSLNLCNYAQWHPNRKTIELRLPEGTVDGKDVKNWVRFFIHFVDSTKKKEFPTDFSPANLYDTMKIVGLHNEEPFYLLSKGLRETKIWIAKRILEFSSKKELRKEAEIFLNTLQKTEQKTEKNLDYDKLKKFLLG
jgi:hypothetical protein